MIARDPHAAAAARHDLIVVGGGIYGVTLALEAARRGLRPLLLERGDFGEATSWNSLRIVHGGLRYLQKLDLPRFFESVGERRWFMQHFPDLVRPLACLMPLYGTGLHRPSVLRLALRMNDFLSRSRNHGVRNDRHLRRGRVVTEEETARRFPLVRPEGLQGGALWFDALMPDSQRLVLELLRWACRCGATALNYVEAREIVVEDGRVRGVSAHDREHDATATYSAPIVVNCAGPWCRELAARFDRDVPPLFHASLAFNVFLDREPISDAALAVTPPTPGARTYFLVPWKQGILAGTFHAPWGAGPDDGPPGEATVERFLSDLRAAVPGLDVEASEVARIHWGLLPAAEPGTEKLAVREVIWNHGSRGGPHGLYSVSGVKFTTARCVALKVLRRILDDGGRRMGAPSDVEPPDPVEIPSVEELQRTLEEGSPGARSLVERLVSDESVVHLDDLLLRRTDWGVRPDVGRSIAVKVCGWLGWSAEREAAELARVSLESPSKPVAR